MTRLKRYQIDRIFLAARRGGTATSSEQQRGGGGASPSSSSPSAMEAWEADFDIISSGHSSPSTVGGVGGWGGAEAGFPARRGDARGGFGGMGGAEGGGGGQFEVAEAEAVLVVSQVRGARTESGNGSRRVLYGGWIEIFLKIGGRLLDCGDRGDTVPRGAPVFIILTRTSV